MPFLNVTRATLSTLSPVHLGSGEDFLPTNYVIDDNGWLHSFNEMVIADVLKNKLEQIKTIIYRENGDSMLRSIQRLIHDHCQYFAENASHSLPVARGFVELYNSRIGQIAQRESHSTVVNKLYIMRTFINPHTHLPIVTGSAIKGAIRTAILNQLAIKAGWNKPQDVRFPKKLPNNLLKFDNPTTDPLKLLKISDSSYQHPDSLPATEIMFAVSKRRVVKEGKTAGGPTTYLEAISGFRSRAFELDIRFLDNASQDPHQKTPKDSHSLAKLCNDYYLPKLKKELRELSDMNYLADNYVNGLNRLLEGELGVALQQNKAFLLRLGKHSGAYHKTLDNIRAIEIPQHKVPLIRDGKPVKNFQGKDVLTPIKVDETPEVRLSATASSQQAVDLLPFGWVLIELGDVNLQQTHALLKELALANDAYRQRDQLLAFKQAQAQAKIEIAAKKLIHEQESAAKLAADIVKAEEEKSRLASLSVESIEVDKLKRQFDSLVAKKWKIDINHILIKELNTLIEQATNWPTNAKKDLRQLAESMYKMANIDVKKNANVKKRLNTLG